MSDKLEGTSKPTQCDCGGKGWIVFNPGETSAGHGSVGSGHLVSASGGFTLVGTSMIQCGNCGRQIRVS